MSECYFSSFENQGTVLHEAGTVPCSTPSPPPFLLYFMFQFDFGSHHTSAFIDMHTGTQAYTHIMQIKTALDLIF